MGALNPLFLLAGAAVAVPLVLHLFQRQEARRVAFPALRYLERTEREHARRIRIRQFLILALRSATVLAVVAAGAGLYLRGSGSAHPPTALVIILDNSMSSGLVSGEARVLDHLKEMALRALADASDRDRIWVIRAGEPWIPPAPGGPDEARRAVRDARPTSTAGDLTGALTRATALVSGAGLRAREIHLLSDLQASGFSPGVLPPAADVPVVAWVTEGAPRPNRALASLLVGGGLEPLEGQRYEVTVTAAPPTGPEDTAAVAVRIVLDGRVRSAGILPPGSSTSLPVPVPAAGWTVGYAEADADALSADDRRWFAFRARTAPRVAMAGDPGVFLREALSVLEAGGRLRFAAPPEVDLLISLGGEALEGAGRRAAALVVPPEDPTLLPALNRRLRSAGLPWRLDAVEREGEATLDGTAVPEPLQGVRVSRWYRLSLAADPVSPTRTWALAAGDPWAVEGTDASGRRYLLLASPMDSASTSLPLSPAMLRLVDWAAGAWTASGAFPAQRVAGSALPAPRDADAVRLPSGAEIPLDATRMLRATGDAGIYTFLAGDSVLSHEAVNPDPAESDLTPLDPERLEEAVGRRVTAVRDGRNWARAVFLARQGPDLTGALVALALALLLVEAVVASSGNPRRGQRRAAEAARDAA
jgi:hypothetical protein